MEPLFTTFKVPFHNHLLAATITRPANQPELKPTILVLHGSGSSNQTHSLYVAEHFARLGVATLRFDQSGHGLSTGHQRTTSLQQKVQEAMAMVPFMETPIHIIGSSMGANTACLMLSQVPVASLTFIAPAIYSNAHHTVPFGSDFQFFLTMPNFWRTSPCWQPLSQFTGKFLLVSAGREDRVNPEVATMLASGSPKSQRTILHYPESDHSVQQWLAKRPAEQQKFLAALTKTITGKEWATTK